MNSDEHKSPNEDYRKIIRLKLKKIVLFKMTMTSIIETVNRRLSSMKYVTQHTAENKSDHLANLWAKVCKIQQKQSNTVQEIAETYRFTKTVDLIRTIASFSSNCLHLWFTSKPYKVLPSKLKQCSPHYQSIPACILYIQSLPTQQQASTRIITIVPISKFTKHCLGKAQSQAFYILAMAKQSTMAASSKGLSGIEKQCQNTHTQRNTLQLQTPGSHELTVQLIITLNTQCKSHVQIQVQDCIIMNMQL